MSEWIHINKGIPDLGVPVLVSDGINVWSAKLEKIGHFLGWSPHGYDSFDIESEFGEPTHWMVMPEPPK